MKEQMNFGKKTVRQLPTESVDDSLSGVKLVKEIKRRRKSSEKEFIIKPTERKRLNKAASGNPTIPPQPKIDTWPVDEKTQDAHEHRIRKIKTPRNLPVEEPTNLDDLSLKDIIHNNQEQEQDDFRDIRNNPVALGKYLETLVADKQATVEDVPREVGFPEDPFENTPAQESAPKTTPQPKSIPRYPNTVPNPFKPKSQENNWWKRVKNYFIDEDQF